MSHDPITVSVEALLWERHAAESSAKFAEQYVRERCRHTEAVADCPHCNLMFLVDFTRRAIALLASRVVPKEQDQSAPAERIRKIKTTVSHSLRVPLHDVLFLLARIEILEGALAERQASLVVPRDGIRFDAESNTYVARHTILTAGHTEAEAKDALASAVRLTAETWPPRPESKP